MNGYGAIVIGVVASTIVYFAYHYMSRVRPFRLVDDTLGVIYTYGVAGLAGGLLVGVLADSEDGRLHQPGRFAMVLGHRQRTPPEGSKLETALWVIIFTAIMTFILLKLVGLVIPLRMSDADMEEGDLAVHGHEVYPSDVPSLGYPGGAPVAAAWTPAPAGGGAPAGSPE